MVDTSGVRENWIWTEAEDEASAGKGEARLDVVFPRDVYTDYKITVEGKTGQTASYTLEVVRCGRSDLAPAVFGAFRE